MSLLIKIFSFCLVILLIIGFALGIDLFFGPIPPKRLPLNQAWIQIGKTRLTVEMVTGAQAISRGLSDRDVLGSDGMLFVLPERTVPTFWMKGMRFDLDFVWIDGTHVVDVTENVSAQHGVPEYQLKVYSPKAVVTHVLEMNAGEISKRQIHVGDRVSY